jgi:hypothetical protein
MLQKGSEAGRKEEWGKPSGQNPGWISRLDRRVGIRIAFALVFIPHTT